MISPTSMTESTHDHRHRRGRVLKSRGPPMPCPQSLKSIYLIATFVTISLIYVQLNALFKLAHCNPQNHHHTQSQRLTTGGGQSPCPQGWSHVGSKCYKFVYSPKSYESAKSRCHELSAELAMIGDLDAAKSNNKEEEEESDLSGAPTRTDITTSLIANLTLAIKPEMQKNKPFYVTISPDLLKQYKQFQQLEASNRSAATYDGSSEAESVLSEHVDTDPTRNPFELWIPHEDENAFSFRYNSTTSREAPGFALFKSDRWGLLPMSPTRKASSICEMPASSTASQADHRHHSRSHHQGPKAFSAESPPTLEPKRASGASSESSGQTAVVIQGTSPSSSNSQATESPKRPTNDRDPLPSKPAQPAATVQDVATSALFRDIPQNQSVVMGSSAEMRCSPIDSDSTLTWTVDGKNLNQSNRVRLHANGTLRIDHVRNKDGGNYTCTIQSGGMSESRSARLEILERPLQPEYIKSELLDKLSTSVRITWQPGFDGNSPIIKYLVEMRTVTSDLMDNQLVAPQIQNSKDWEIAKANISADLTSVIIADLKPARKYIFRIRAANKIGTSEPSIPSWPPVEVPVQPPSMAPERLSGTARSSTSILVHWLPPPADSQNGVIKSYKIRHKLAGYSSDTDWFTKDVPEAANLNFVLDDLITWQNYEIQVAAENDKGVGPFSSSVFVQTKEGKPDKGPRNVVAEPISSTVIKVTWNPPPPQHINGINLGYKVQLWYDVAQTQLAKEIAVNHNMLTQIQATTVDGLQAYTKYHVSVRCFTSAGDGVPNEEPRWVRTKQDLPEAVQSFEFADVLDTSLRVIWKPPERINGELHEYTLEYSETNSSDKRQISKSYPASANEARIVDLSHETLYTFRIFAHTDVGPGPAKVAQIKTSVPPVLPEPPSNLVPINIGPYSVTVQFQPKFDGNAAIEKWIAEAWTPSLGNYKSTWQTVYISTNHTQGTNTVVVRNLRPYTRYKIRLTPVNIAGRSPYASEPTAEFQTNQIEPEHAPRDLTIEEVKSNSALARWSPLSITNWSGHPHGYNLTWVESGNASVNYQFINETRADSTLVHDLEEYTEYTFRIYAVNDAGPSPPGEPVVITTLEDVPSSGPTNITARALTSSSVSVDWSAVPKRHRNGIIKGYKIQYQAQKPNAPLQYKSVEENNTKHVILNDLKPFTLYQLAVAAYTSMGDGVYGPILSVQTLEDTPGLPQNVSLPTVTQNTARILWDPPEETNGDILGYKISYQALTDDGQSAKDVVSQELQQNERTFKATNLKPETHYLFTVSAKTKEGWGQQASTYVYTRDLGSSANLPFYKQGWFVLLCACLSFVITIVVIALLAVQTKSYKYKQDAMKSTSQDRLGDAGFTIDDAPEGHYNNGFGLLSNGAHHRRSNGAISQGTANFTLPKTPPRPHPGSVVYSDDDGDDDVFEDVIEKPVVGVKSVAGTSHYDSSSGDSITEKPSEISSSPAPESESADDEYVNMANRHFVNHYANVNGTLRSQRSWKKSGTSINGASTSGKHYASTHRTKPKLPQRPAPSVPQVPIDHSQSSSDNASNQPIAGTSGMQHASRSDGINGAIYGETHTFAKSSHHHQQQQQQLLPDSSRRTLISASQLQQQLNGTSNSSNGGDLAANNETYPKMEQHQQQNNKNTQYQQSQKQQQQQQQFDLLNNNHLVNLNGGRIIVDNMAGSRAPLPGFTSFV